MKRKLIAVALVLSLLSPSVLHAEKGLTVPQDFSLSLKGSSGDIFYKEVSPGDSLSVELQVKNEVNKSRNFLIYPSDQISADYGGWSFHPDSDENSLYGKWASPQKVIDKSIAGNKTTSIKYTIEVPEQIEPGQYILGLVVRPKDPYKSVTNDGSSLGLSQELEVYQFRQIVLTYKQDRAEGKLDFPGLNKVFGPQGNLTLRVQFRNQGKVLVKSSGEFKLKSKADNRLIQEGTYSMDSIYTGSSAVLPVAVSGFLDKGKYDLSLEGTYTPNNPYKVDIPFEITEAESNLALGKMEEGGIVDVDRINLIWIYITIILGVLLLTTLIILVIFLRKKKKEDKNPAQE